ncbi:MAG: DUF3122 domain-containing protein [Pegethrix bostrychoides GSE-TBD4-15B]|jgi:hypothetical protein|uniref:DUF3122 domain-containing protein n=1 Tax=Pegethrix bostrychoides GSE-TBD4-15B TaxID=2839662 RepID=A0A951U7E9_9CYAN|nr:DUF3122 domain-containing protein [Pegethrix bostrychoides GSE-TBD4-15B]
MVWERAAWRAIWLFCVGLLVLAFSLPAQAAILYNADTSGAVVVQSRRTLRDQRHYSWQVIAFKSIDSDQREAEIALRLVGFPGAVEIDQSQPIRLSAPNRQLTLANISDQILLKTPQLHVGQYDLQSVLPDLLTEYRLELHIPTASTDMILPISPALIEEWQTIVNTHYADLVGACNQFPSEAKQNPAFPAWVGCR